MANAVLTADVVAREGLDILVNGLGIAKKVYRAYEPEWRKNVNGYAKGDIVRIKKPARFIANDGSDITSQIQDFAETNTSVTVDQRKNVAWKFSSEELTLDITEYSKRVLEPALRPLIERLDFFVAGLHTQMYNVVGTAGTTPSTFKDLLRIQKKFDDISAPQMERCSFLDTEARLELVDGLKGVFQPTMVEGWLKKAAIGTLAGVDFFTSTFIKTHTGGIATGTPPINDGAIAAGDTSLITAGWTATQTGILKEGDIITFAGVYAVDYVNKNTKDFLQTFRITADVNSDGAGAATIAFSPALNFNALGSQNISALPVTGAAIAVVSGTGSQVSTRNIAFTEQSIALACVPLAMPDSVVWGSRESSEDGLSIRIYKFMDGLKDIEYIRADILFGGKVIYPETCMIVQG